MRQIHIPTNEQGQSAVEFILTFAFALGLTFLFASQGLNLTKGYLVHYANFMAARTYLVHDIGVDVEQTNLQRASDKASDIFNAYPLTSFDIRARFRVVPPRDGRGFFSGGVSEFEEGLSVLSTVGGSGNALFYSESLLGREPFRITCFQQVCEAVTGNRRGCQGQAPQMDIVLYDNGC